MNSNSHSNNRGNNNNNNRRRGRGGNNRQNGGQPINRIDSRARGNAPQMLEKYRKLAHDAHLNGDRVQEEYYLQFADHYFRVLADQRQRQEEQRAQRPEGAAPFREDNRGGNYGDESGGDYGPEGGEGSSYDPSGYNNRDDRSQRDSYRDETPREAASSDDDGQGEATSEPPENPFLRSQRQPREARPPRRDNPRDGRRDERPRSEEQRPRSEEQRPRREPRRSAEPEAQLGLDPSMLPPAISVARVDEAPVAEVEEAAPRRRGRPRKTASDAGDTLEAVS